MMLFQSESAPAWYFSRLRNCWLYSIPVHLQLVFSCLNKTIAKN